MTAVLGSVVAVVGTLLGSFTTYWFQRRTARKTEDLARSERLRQERMSAYADCAAAMSDLSRGLATLWLRRNDSADTAAAQAEADHLGSLATTAKLRLVLVSARPEPLADKAFNQVNDLLDAADIKDLKARERSVEMALSAFIQDAAARLLTDYRNGGRP